MPNRLPIVGGNWKMYGNRAHARELLHALRAALDGISDVDVVICPPAPWLGDAADTFAGGSLGVGAQNVYWEPDGAFTGVGPTWTARPSTPRHLPRLSAQSWRYQSARSLSCAL